LSERTGVNLWTWTDICSMTEDSEKPEPGPQRRIFPPLYKSSGDLASDRLAFFHVLERLKVCLFHHHPFTIGLAYSILLFVLSTYRIADTEANGMGR
jgi:hypothetical protein